MADTTESSPAAQPADPRNDPKPGPRTDPELPARLRAVQIRTPELVRLRVLFTAIVRLLGFFLALTSVLPVGWWLLEGIMDGDLWWLEYYWPRLALAFYMLVAGVGMAVFGGLLAAMLVRPRQGRVSCPMCSFELTGLDRGRCTECGYELNPALPEFGVPPIERVLVARLAAFVLVRLVSVGLVTLSLIPMMRFVVVDVWEGYANSVGFVEAFLPFMAISMLGLSLWLLAGPLSALMVPMRWARKLAESRTNHEPGGP